MIVVETCAALLPPRRCGLSASRDTSPPRRVHTRPHRRTHRPVGVDSTTEARSVDALLAVPVATTAVVVPVALPRHGLALGLGCLGQGLIQVVVVALTSIAVSPPTGPGSPLRPTPDARPPTRGPGASCGCPGSPSERSPRQPLTSCQRGHRERTVPSLSRFLRDLVSRGRRYSLRNTLKVLSGSTTHTDTRLRSLFVPGGRPQSPRSAST